MSKTLTPGTAVSPIDGRYASKTAVFSTIFSEMALMRYRLIVEIEYFIFLFHELKELRYLSFEETNLLRGIYRDFDFEDFEAIQQHESVTGHDVKAVEYFLRDKLKVTTMEDLTEFVHIGRTSEDINNLAYALALREGTEILKDKYNEVKKKIDLISNDHGETPMLALTHGQPASPTTMGWEMNVFASRISKYIHHLNRYSISVKFNGATGGNNAMAVAFPDVVWNVFAGNFIDHLAGVADGKNYSMKFEHNIFTTQIEPHDTYAELFGILSTLNNILIDFCRDMWMYISRDVFTQKPVDGEVGSSAMPQKINPIKFENAEGNLGLANSSFDHFRNKLPVSRMQRDLSDSTVERNFGVAYAHTYLALDAICAGMRRVYVNTITLKAELDANPEVISEAYQVILRVNGVKDGYEKLKDLTRGRKVGLDDFRTFAKGLYDTGSITQKVYDQLCVITPHNYIGER